MNKPKKRNWLITIFIGITLGLALLIIIKNSLNPMNDRLLYRVKTDLISIKVAIEQYKSRYGFYPVQSKKRLLNFAEQLSDQQPSRDLKESREMYVDYISMAIGVDNVNYRAANADSATLLDPWKEAYLYISDGKSFTIWSTGADRVNSNTNGDDVSQISIFNEAISK
jgi:hypothetical protein